MWGGTLGFLVPESSQETQSEFGAGDKSSETESQTQFKPKAVEKTLETKEREMQFEPGAAKKSPEKKKPGAGSTESLATPTPRLQSNLLLETPTPPRACALAGSLTDAEKAAIIKAGLHMPVPTPPMRLKRKTPPASASSGPLHLDTTKIDKKLAKAKAKAKAKGQPKAKGNSKPRGKAQMKKPAGNATDEPLQKKEGPCQVSEACGKDKEPASDEEKALSDSQTTLQWGEQLADTEIPATQPSIHSESDNDAPEATGQPDDKLTVQQSCRPAGTTDESAWPTRQTFAGRNCPANPLSEALWSLKRSAFYKHVPQEAWKDTLERKFWNIYTNDRTEKKAIDMFLAMLKAEGGNKM